MVCTIIETAAFTTPGLKSGISNFEKDELTLNGPLLFTSEPIKKIVPSAALANRVEKFSKKAKEVLHGHCIEYTLCHQILKMFHELILA